MDTLLVKMYSKNARCLLQNAILECNVMASELIKIKLKKLIKNIFFLPNAHKNNIQTP